MNNGNSNSKAPLIIIGLVLVAVIAGVWWLMNRNMDQSRSSGTANRSAGNTATAKTPATTNVLGAQPPNFLGSPNALVTIEEFADFQCGACASVHPRMKELTSVYGSRIKFIFRHYPLAIPAHDKAYEAAVAAEAAGLQGRFWEMQNLLFTNQQNWTSNPDYRKVWEGYASQLGLDVERFKNDMAGMNAKSRVDADIQRGRALNINSTPSIFINGMAIPFEQMTPDTMRQIIDAELQKAQSGNSNQGQTNSGGAQSSQPASNTSDNPANAVKK